MKFAILVLACRQPAILEALIGTLDHPDIGFFVHVDRKSNEDFSRLKDCTARSPVTVIREREVFWGGYSMVEATNDLIALALRVPSVRRLTLISDDSFVITSQAHFFEVMDSGLNLWTGKPNSFRHRYDQAYLPDSPASCPRNPELETRHFREADIPALEGLLRIMKTGKYPLETVYKGSQWWSLTRKAVEAALERLEDPWLRDSFRYSLVPDESVMPTLLSLAGVGRDGCALHDNWDRKPRPYVYQHLWEVPRSVPGRTLFLRKVRSASCPLVRHAKALFESAEPDHG
ncbi:beta-1,6-N-acetylglucosaminyltransferase [Azospirillum sp. sgz302134]